MEEAIFFDFSGRSKLQITGTDRVRFLNGQLTNNVSKATADAAIEACILSAKGKLNGHVFLASGPDCFWMDADDGLRETLPARLERYIISDDVQIRDVSDEMAIFHVLGPSIPGVDVEARIVAVRRFLKSGWDIWIDKSSRGVVFQRLSATFQFVDQPAAERLRVEQGIPKWGSELTEEIIPIEANLESRTIDYEKGCYIGQEVISRIKMSGQTNKRLCGLVSLTEKAMPPGTRLTSGGQDVGWVTSSIRSEGREISLGYVKRGFQETGRKLEAIGPGADTVLGEAEIVPLPAGPGPGRP